MCKETYQKYSSCYCCTILFDICAPHIEHTRLQIDNEPCPGLIHMTTESARGCRPRAQCVRKKDTFYTFETNGIRVFERERERREKEERERRERQERERKMREREEQDRLWWEGRRKKVKKEKTDGAGEEFNLNQVTRWVGKVKAREGNMDV